MELLDKVRVNPNICGIELAFRGQVTATSIPGWQQFYNSGMVGTDFTKTHIGLGSVSFGEESEESAAGISYKQSVTIGFLQLMGIDQSALPWCKKRSPTRFITWPRRVL